MDRIKDRYFILGLIALQLCVCIPFLDSFPVDLDEPFSIFYSQQPLAEFVPFLLKGNNPPLYFILLSGWIKLFGISAFALRFLSLIFACLTIIPLFKLSKKVVKKEFAIGVCGFFIFSTFNHYHALEMRMYSLMVLETVTIVYLLYIWFFEEKRYFLLLGILNAALLYTHYLGIFIVGIELILFAIYYRSVGRKGFVFGFIAFAFSSLLFLPMLVKSISNVSNFASSGTWLETPNLTELYGNVIRFFNYNISFFILFGLLITGALVFRLDLKARLLGLLKEKKKLFVFVFFILSYGGMFVFSFVVQPVFLDRYLLFTSPFLFILMFLIADTIVTKYRSVAALLLVIPMLASCYYIPRTNRDADVLANFVNEIESEHTVIAICPPFYDLTFIYHYDKELFSDYDNFDKNLVDAGIQKVYSFQDIKIKESTNKVIYVNANSDFLYPGNNVLNGLVENHIFIQERRFLGGYMVHEFNLKDD